MNCEQNTVDIKQYLCSTSSTAGGLGAPGPFFFTFLLEFGIFTDEEKVFLTLGNLLFIFFNFCRILSGVGLSDVIWFGCVALSKVKTGQGQGSGETLVADRGPTGNKTRHSQGFCHELRTTV